MDFNYSGVIDAASQPSSGGAVWEGLNTTLNTALQGYLQIEQAKAVADASGVSRITQQSQPELENGAAVLIDTKPQQPLGNTQQAGTYLKVGVGALGAIVGGMALVYLLAVRR